MLRIASRPQPVSRGCHGPALSPALLPEMGYFAMRDLDFSLLTANHDSQKAVAGDVIFSRGDTADKMYIVKSGQVELRLGSLLLDTVGPNGIFGEMAVVDGGTRSASAVAVSETELVPLSEKQVVFLIGETPYFALKLLGTITARLRATTRASDHL